MELEFLGGAGTVTGSKALVRHRGRTVLVDCGLFQGLKELRLRNWDPFPVDPATLDAVLLTHAHLDHSGYLPALVKGGFRGPIHCTTGTRDLCRVLLKDSARLMEEDAGYANRHGTSKHHPALPLFTEEDAERALELFRPVHYEETVELWEGWTLRFSRAGHIIGSACAHLALDDTLAVFSGDVGRLDDSIMRPPVPLRMADLLVVESTYGNRRHEVLDPRLQLKDLVCRVAARGGVVLIPAFAVGRTQLLLHLLSDLKASGEIPDLPVYLNSPMALEATEIYCHHHDDHRIPNEACRALCALAKPIRTVEESKALNGQHYPMVILAGSGMLSGGRILHHLRAFGSDPRNALALAGYQAPGTRGASLLGGAGTLRIFGEDLPIRLEVVRLEGLSAHADYEELGTWLRSLEAPPKQVLVNHGDPEAAAALAAHLRQVLGWTCEVAATGRTWTLS